MKKQRRLPHGLSSLFVFRSFLTAPRFYVRTCSDAGSDHIFYTVSVFSKSIVPINFAAEAFICYRISRVIFMNRAYGNNIIGSEYRYLQFRRKILLLFDCFFCDGFIQNLSPPVEFLQVIFYIPIIVLSICFRTFFTFFIISSSCGHIGNLRRR